MTTVSQEIRDAVAAHPKGISIDKIMEQISGKAGRSSVGAICYQHVNREIFTSKADAEQGTLFLPNPGYTQPPPRDDSTPTNRSAGKRTAGRRATAKEKPVKKGKGKKRKYTFRKLREKLVKTPAADVAVAILALDNLLEASADLRKAVESQVDKLETDKLLHGAVLRHERAEKLYHAVAERSA